MNLGIFICKNLFLIRNIIAKFILIKFVIYHWHKKNRHRKIHGWKNLQFTAIINSQILRNFTYRWSERLLDMPHLKVVMILLSSFLSKEKKLKTYFHIKLIYFIWQLLQWLIVIGYSIVSVSDFNFIFLNLSINICIFSFITLWGYKKNSQAICLSRCFELRNLNIASKVRVTLWKNKANSLSVYRRPSNLSGFMIIFNIYLIQWREHKESFNI